LPHFSLSRHSAYDAYGLAVRALLNEVSMRKTWLWIGVCASLLGASAGAQEQADKSAHQVRFIAVGDSVQLEVLDWGGSGRAVVLLAGLGNTAHSFDGFAPKLAASYHVYGVTRRGFGRSSSPAFGYGADELADDVLAVLDSLRLSRPVVAGHSIAGEELSSIGLRHPDKVAGLVYLDAGYDYAFYDESHGNLTIDINEIVGQLDKLRQGSGASPQERRKADRALDTSLADFLKGVRGSLSEPEHPGNPVSIRMDRVPYAVISGERKYTAIHGPVLAIFATSRAIPPGADPEMRSMIAQVDSAMALQIGAFARGVPQARIVQIPGANHFVFTSNEAEVLREMRSFIDGLPRTPK
jgi:non-heme chloroperoxidase